MWPPVSLSCRPDMGGLKVTQSFLFEIQSGVRIQAVYKVWEEKTPAHPPGVCC